MKLRSVKLESEFVPEFNGNKSLPANEQVVVEIKDHVSNLQLASYRKFVYRGGETTVEYDDTSMMIKHVGKIRNLEDDSEVISDGIKLADSKNKQLFPLMVEIRNYLIGIGEVIPEGES